MKHIEATEAWWKCCGITFPFTVYRCSSCGCYPYQQQTTKTANAVIDAHEETKHSKLHFGH